MTLSFNQATIGVYLLRDEKGRVVYVGQSNNIISRIGTHAANPEKKFYSVTVIPCAEDELDDLEGLLIRAICPEQNGTPGPSSKYWKDVFHWGEVPPHVQRLADGIQPQAQSQRKSKAQEAVRAEPTALAVKATWPDATYLSDRDIAAAVGVNRATVWRWVNTQAGFPKPVKLSPQISRWKRSEIMEWFA